MRREALIEAIEGKLRRRRLVWFGTRGDDAEALTDVTSFSASFSIISAYQKRSTVFGMSFEDIIRRRVDLDAHDIDDEVGTPELSEIRRALLQVTSSESAVLTYRPSKFLSAVCFARRDRCQYLGMFKDHQAAFEHKPWVETELRDIGVDVIPWTYVADEEQLETLRYLDSGPVMLRRSHSSGGTGFVQVSDRERLAEAWPHESEAYVSVAPFLEGGVPINVGAVVWDDGGVTVHPASVQLTGIPALTERPFGYCGNDFGAFSSLGDDVIRSVEDSTGRIGQWLYSRGYRGAYGVDYLLVDGKLLFTEINPRLQGSTHLSSLISAEAGESCILLEHLAASLGIASPTPVALEQQCSYAGTLSHLVFHNVTGSDLVIDPVRVQDMERYGLPIVRSDVRPSASNTISPGATVARYTTSQQVTDQGFDLRDGWAEWAGHLVEILRDSPSGHSR